MGGAKRRMGGDRAKTGAAADLPWIGRVPADYVFTELPPTAQRILVAAQHLLARDGWRGLTLRRIAAEAGENKSLIIYHFESKSGLLEALVDSLWHDVDVELVQTVEALPEDSPERVGALVRAQAALSRQREQYQMYWELVPHLVHDRVWRERMAALNESYRDLGESCLRPLGLPDDQIRPLASFLLAVLDGMGVLVQLLPDADDEAVYDLLASVLGVAGSSPAGTSRDTGGVAPAGAVPAGATADRPSAGVSSAGGVRPCAAGRPVENPPDEALGPVARNLLRGAVRVLRRRGYEGLTFEAVAKEAGEPRSATTYYFGDKHGLEVAVLEALIYEKCRLDERLLTDAVGAVDPLSAVFGMFEHILADRRAYRVFYELLPVVLRDEELLSRQVAFDRWLLDGLGTVLTGGAPAAVAQRSTALAVVLLAAADGLALQRLLDPRGFDPAPSLEVYRSLLMEWAGAGGPSRRA